MNISRLTFVKRSDVIETTKESLQLSFIKDLVREMAERVEDMLLQDDLSSLDFKSKKFHFGLSYLHLALRQDEAMFKNQIIKHLYVSSVLASFWKRSKYHQ